MSTDPDRRSLDEAEAALRGLLAAPRLDDATRARHLHRIREAAALAPRPAGRVARPAGRVGQRTGWRHVAGRLGVQRRRLAAGTAATSMLLVLGAGTAVAASSSAVPGDLLYPVKAAAEQASLVLPRSQEGRTRLLLGLAERRLVEVEALAGGEAPPGVMTDTIAAHQELRHRAATVAGDDEALAALVRAATERAQARLELLLDTDQVGSDRAREALAEALRRMRAEDGRPGRPAPAGVEAPPDGRPGRPAGPSGPSGPSTGSGGPSGGTAGDPPAPAATPPAPSPGRPPATPPRGRDTNGQPAAPPTPDVRPTGHPHETPPGAAGRPEHR